MVEIKVYGHDVEKALRILKRQLQKEGLFKEITRRFHEKPSEKKKRKQKDVKEERAKARRFKRS